MGRIAWIFAAATAAAISATAAHAADSIGDAYKDKQLKLILSSSPGGGYDLYARTIARHVSSHLPGTVTN